MKTIIILLISSIAFADSNVDAAAKRVQEEMKDPAKRQGLINTDAAKNEMHKLNAMTGGDPQAQQEIMEITSELIPVLMEISGSDPAKMMENLDKFKANPQEFASRIPAAQQEKIKKLAERITNNKKKKP